MQCAFLVQAMNVVSTSNFIGVSLIVITSLFHIVDQQYKTRVAGMNNEHDCSIFCDVSLCSIKIILRVE